MSDIIIISGRKELVDVIKPLSGKKNKIIDLSEDAVSYLKDNKVGLIILDLDTKDLNIFVAHELLKTAKTENQVAVIVTYSEKKESEIEDYKKLLHPPDEFIKESDLIIKLNDLLEKYYKVTDKSKNNKEKKQNKELIDTESFAKELNDEIDNMDIFNNDLLGKDDASQGIFIVDDGNGHSGELDISIGANAETKSNEIQIKKTENKLKKEDKKIKDETKSQKSSDKAEKKANIEKDTEIADMKAEVISLQKQNEFIRGENKDLIKAQEELKKELERLNKELAPLNNELEQTKLATKELIENKDKELEALKLEIEQVKSDKKILETSLMEQIGILNDEKKELDGVLQKNDSDLEALKKEQKDLVKQLESETKKSESVKKELETIEKAKDEKEKILITSIDHLKKSILVEEEKNAKYKGKFDELSELSAKLSKIVKDLK